MQPYIPDIKPILPKSPENPNLIISACKYFDRIQETLEEMEKELKEDEILEISVPLNDGNQIHVESMGCKNMSMILIGGKYKNGEKVEALIHQNSLQLLITKIKITKGEEKKFVEFLDKYKRHD